MAQYQSVMGMADQTAQKPFQAYGTPGATNADGSAQTFVAPVNAEQTAGISGTNTAATEAQPYYDAATGTLSQTQNNTTGINNAATGLAAASAGQVNADPLTGQQINSYMSPYLGDVLNTTDALANQNNNIAQSGALGTAISSGAFGGDRTGIAAANLNQQNELALNSTNANILNTGYNTALGTAQQQQGVNLSAGQANRTALANAGQELSGIGATTYGEGANTASELGALGSGAQTAGLQGANAQIAAGTVQQQTAQAADTAEYNQFLQQQSFPYQVDSWLGSLAEGTGALSGSTTQTTQPGGFFSDRRLKHDIKKIGKTYDGQEIYSYKMHGDARTHIGLMAQEVEKKRPKAVGVDPGSGYKMVDYGQATEKAANRGHFYEGGVVPMRRVARASGGPSIVDAGDLSAILQAQQGMYAPMSGGASGVYGGGGSGVPRGGSSRVPAPEGAVPHLVTAQGSLKQQPTGVQNLSSAASLYKEGKGIYDDSQKPVRHTVTTTTPGGVAPAAWSSPGANFDGSAAAAAPDSSPTDANPYRRGGVAAGRRGYDGGGDVDFDSLAAAHGAMYGQGSHGAGVDIPSGGGGTHQLAVASGTPQPAPSGSSNLNQGLGVVQKGQQIYNKMSAPSAPNSAPNLTNSATIASAPESDSGTISGIASNGAGVAAPAASDTAAAASAGSGAAAGVAGDAAAGAAADAGGAAAADAAAALAAEYAAADVGAAALIAAKRGGRIRRPGFDAGGMPYSQDDGSLDIPDTSSGAAKLQIAGPLQKQPTGLQTLETLGTEQGAQGAISGMFSNQALKRGGVAGRRGYADGGDPDDTDNTDAGPSTAPTGLAAADTSAPAAKDPALKMDSGPSWWDRNKGKAIPLLEGLAAMGTAPTKHLGVALAAGLGAGAGAYVPTQAGLANTRETEADITGKNIQNQVAQQNADLYKQMIASQGKPMAAAPTQSPVSGPVPVNSADIPGYYQSQFKYNPNMTPEEAKDIETKTAIDKKFGSALAPAAQIAYQQRIQNLKFQAESGSQARYDKLVTGVVNANANGDSAYTNLKQIDPGMADGVARKAGLDPTAQDRWNPDQVAKADQVAAQVAAQHAAIVHQYTGKDYTGANAVDPRTNVPAVGPAAAQLSPEGRSNRQLSGLDTITVGAGLPQTKSSIIGNGPPPGPAGTPQPAAPARQPARAPAGAAPAVAPSAPQTQTLPGVDLNQIPKLPPIPAAVDQPTKARADQRATSDVTIGNAKMDALSQQASDAARNTAIYSQLRKTLDSADPREFGPSSKAYKALQNFKTYLSGIPPDGLVNQAEADKFLVQLGVGGSRQLLGAGTPPRQEELMTLMAHANPNMDQPLQVIKNLANYGEAGNNYDFKAANTGISAIRNNNADPYQVAGAIENQAHRADYINGELTTPKAAKDYLAAHPEAAPHFKKKYGYLP